MPNVPARLADDGLSYDEYRAHWRTQKAQSPKGKDPDARKMIHYLNYDWERQAHVHDAYTPSETLSGAVASIEAPQTWMVLTEPWCGDSAFLLPVIAEAAAQTDAVSLRILLRDDHLAARLLDQLRRGKTDAGTKHIDEAGYEQSNAGPLIRVMGFVHGAKCNPRWRHRRPPRLTRPIRGRVRSPYWAVQPPSIGSDAPLICAAASEHRNTA